MGLFSKFLPPDPANRTRTSSLLIDGGEVQVTLRQNRNAHRFILRLDKDRSGVVVTLPADGSERQAMEFAASHAGWIRKQLSAVSGAVPFAAGNTIAVRGIDHRIVHHPEMRGTPWVSDGDLPDLNVTGRPEHLARRVKDWLKREARQDLLAASGQYAEAMQLKFSKVSVRDQTTRWGSCSSNRTLSYSWRLILAPPFVLDYVAAHEVAHLEEMNHSARFWALVNAHCAHAGNARRWLKKNGRDLHKYG